MAPSYSRLLVLAATATAALAEVPAPGDDGRYTISSDGIRAQVRQFLRRHRNFIENYPRDLYFNIGEQFIPYGATLTNLYVKDKNGEDVDVVLGYDDLDLYGE